MQEDKRSPYGDSLRSELPSHGTLNPHYSLEQKPQSSLNGHHTKGQPVASTGPHRAAQGDCASPPTMPSSSAESRGRDAGVAQEQPTRASNGTEPDTRGTGSGQASTTVSGPVTAKLPQQARAGAAQRMARTQEGHGGLEPAAVSPSRGVEDGKASSSAGEGRTLDGVAKDQGSGPVEDGVRQAGSAAGETASGEAGHKSKPVKRWPAKKRGRKKGTERVNPFALKLKPLTPEEELLPLTEEFKTRLKVRSRCPGNLRGHAHEGCVSVRACW